MTNSKLKFVFIAVIAFGLSFTSCGNESNKTQDEHSEINHDQDHSELNHEHDHSEMNKNSMTESNTKMDSNAKTSDGQQVLADYLALKDALVETNKDKASKAGLKLESTLNSFDVSSYSSEQQDELKDIITDAKEHAEHIGKSEMDHQREHFKTLSKDIVDMVAITGTDNKMYEQFCPMYDGGSVWLSMEKDVKNPFYGNKMLTCGKVLKEIN